jgi:chromosome segregation ATPase
MVGEKRSYPGHSPDPYASARKTARCDVASYHPVSNGGRDSNPTSRRSSFSQSMPPVQAGSGVSRSRDGDTNLQGLPKTLESFVVAILKHNQSSQHLKNVETDYEDMLPRHKDFPALGTQKSTRLSQARQDFEATTVQTAEATTLLLDALKGHFPGPSGPASHQDCISRSEFDTMKDELRAGRADSHEIKRLREENFDMKERLRKMENLLRENRSVKRTEDQFLSLEKLNRATKTAVESACQNHALLHEQTNKDRLSFRTRCSVLESEMEKSKSRFKELTQASESIRSTLDGHSQRSKSEHEGQARDLELVRSNIEALQQKLNKEIDNQPKDTPAVSALSSTLDTIESRLSTAEELMKSLSEDVVGREGVFTDQLDEMQSDVDKLQAELNNMQTNHDEENLGKRITSENIQYLKSSMDALTTNFTRLEEQGASQGVPEDLKQHLEYISKTVETHIDLLQRHEIRLNSVTTDDLYRQMESQFRQNYGVPAELRGLIQRQNKLESALRTRK